MGLAGRSGLLQLLSALPPGLSAFRAMHLCHFRHPLGEPALLQGALASQLPCVEEVRLASLALGPSGAEQLRALVFGLPCLRWARMVYCSGAAASDLFALTRALAGRGGGGQAGAAGGGGCSACAPAFWTAEDKSCCYRSGLFPLSATLAYAAGEEQLGALLLLKCPGGSGAQLCCDEVILALPGDVGEAALRAAAAELPARHRTFVWACCGVGGVRDVYALARLARAVVAGSGAVVEVVEAGALGRGSCARGDGDGAGVQAGSGACVLPPLVASQQRQLQQQQQLCPAASEFSAGMVVRVRPAGPRSP